MPSAPDPVVNAVPRRVGRYQVLLPIASGGMATVYLARSRGARGFEHEVALKLTHAHLRETAEFAAILLEEARIASRIKHRNVVSIVDVGEDPLGLFLVMEYVEGDTLAGLLRGGATRSEHLPPEIGLRVLLDALAGLHAAHELRDEAGQLMHVVHRDFSPQNILIGLDGVAQLTDFGIAKAAGRLGDTATGIVKGKASYMSPEHARSRPIDRRADVWSAGVVAWEILSGRRLYPKMDGLEILLQVVSERPARLRSVRPHISSEVDAVVAKALEPDLSSRWETAALFGRELARAFSVSGHVADHEAVAEYVRRVVGPKLAERVKQVNRTLSLRAKMDAVFQASVDPALDDDTLSPASTPEPMPIPEPTLPMSSDARTEMSPLLLAGTPDVTSTSDTGAGRASSVARRTRWGWQRPVSAGGLVLVGLGGWFVLRREPAQETAMAPTVVAASGTVSSVPPPAPLPAARPSRNVTVHANAQLASLRVNARQLTIVPPSQETTFGRLPEDPDGVLTLTATAIDGRHGSATLTPDAVTVEITFPRTALAPAHPAAVVPPPKKVDTSIPPNPFATGGGR